ncbi:sensor domain-containing protein [Halorubrum yunnanense]|uniref:Sensor domain-containing protein n=1 Tax=Halorubrum yunnanense TaxID=1526162 RepID=A0ABD5YBP0_9EURY|nr:sensor domain-containing protein [Halorubrum yunnanense]
MVSLRSLSALPVVGVVVDGQTYRHLLYLLLAVPLGVVYSTAFAFGVMFGLVLSVALVGFVILLATLIGARLAAGFERRLANALLGTRLARPDDLTDADGALAGVRTYVDARSTWTGVGFVSLKFWVSLFAFVPVFLLANALPLIAAPLRYPYAADFGEVNGEPVTWAIDTLPEALVALPLGVAGVLVALHVTNLVAYAARQMAVALLGRPDAAGSQRVTSGASSDPPTGGDPDGDGGPTVDVDAADSDGADVPGPDPADAGDDDSR